MLYNNHNTEKNKFQELKEKSLIIGQFFAEIDRQEGLKRNRTANVINCGSDLIFGICPNDGYRHLLGANFCHNRFCPLCAWRRQKRFYIDTCRIFEVLESKKTFEFIFMTLTVKNPAGADLKSTIEQMQKAFDRLMKRRKVKRAVKGYIKALEVTYNKQADTYHPHFHLVLVVTKDYFKSADLYLSQQEVITLWQECLKETYLPNVDIRKTGAANKTASELVKYTLKFKDIISHEVLKTLDEALRGKRCISYGGICATLKRELHIQDIESNTADLTDGVGRCPRCGSQYEIELQKWNFAANTYITEQLYVSQKRDTIFI